MEINKKSLVAKQKQVEADRERLVAKIQKIDQQVTALNNEKNMVVSEILKLDGKKEQLKELLGTLENGGEANNKAENRGANPTRK